MRFLRKIKSWIGRNEGSVAVEFALISIPLVYTTIAIIELSLFFAGSNMLEAGINQSARIIRTGQLQEAGGDPEEAFRTELCDHLLILVKCSDVSFEVVSMGSGGSFGDAGDFEPQFDEDGNFEPREFDAGESEDVVMIRAYYRYQLLTPIFAQIFSREPDEKIAIMSTVVIQSEPYDFDG